jgi:hypothetical protein
MFVYEGGHVPKFDILWGPFGLVGLMKSPAQPAEAADDGFEGTY